MKINDAYYLKNIRIFIIIKTFKTFSYAKCPQKYKICDKKYKHCCFHIKNSFE